MSCIYKYIVILLLTTRCSEELSMSEEEKNELDFHIKSHMSNHQRSTGKDLPFFKYIINCYRKTADDSEHKEEILTPTESEDTKECSMEMYDKKRIQEIIDELKQDQNRNYIIILKFKEESYDFNRFIKFFNKRLETNEIKNAIVKYRINQREEYFYNLKRLCTQMYDNHITSYTLVEENGFSTYKIDFHNESINKLMKNRFDFYFRDIKDENKKRIINEHFLTHRLVYYNFLYFENEENLLKKYPSESATYSERNEEISTDIKDYFEQGDLDIPDVRHLNVLFHFFQDSQVLKDMVKKIMEDKESKDYSVFTEILKDLRIKIDDKNKDVISGTKEGEKPKDIYDSIYTQIEILCIEDHIRTFKNISIFFYLYLKKINFKDLDEIMKIIEEHIFKDTFTEKNIRIVKKLIEICREDVFSNGVYDIYDIIMER